MYIFIFVYKFDYPIFLNPWDKPKIENYFGIGEGFRKKNIINK